MNLTLETTSIIVKYFRRNVPRMLKQMKRTNERTERWTTMERCAGMGQGHGDRGAGAHPEACVSAHNLAATWTAAAAPTADHRSSRSCWVRTLNRPSTID